MGRGRASHWTGWAWVTEREGSSMLIGKFYDCLRADHVRSLPVEGFFLFPSLSLFFYLLCIFSAFFSE
jgi:hypothetical protein